MHRIQVLILSLAITLSGAAPAFADAQGNKAQAVLNYRRNRMYKQALYDLCISRSVSDQDRLGCASVVKPMSMSDVTANGAYLRSHPAAQELFVCLKQRTEKFSAPTRVALAKAEADCLGSAHLDVLQSVYLADLPRCQLNSDRDTPAGAR